MKLEKPESTSILFITDIFGGLAGAERNLYHIATSLNKKGDKTIICSLKSIESGVLMKKSISEGLRVINLNIKRVYSPSGILKIISLLFLIKRENIKLIIAYHNISDLIGVILSIFSGIPIVSNRRDMGYKLAKRHISIYKLINPFFDKIITVSNAVKNILIEREGVHPFKITTIHNGVYPNFFSQQVNTSEIKERLKLFTNKSIVGAIGGFRKIKGHRFFIEAIPAVLKEIPDAQFIIVGGCTSDEEKNLKQDLINLAGRLGISESVHFYGPISEINEIMQVIDVLVMPSLSEGFSNTIIEAMAAGKPVIATNVGGNPEAVEHGKTGLLVRPADPKALAEAILRLLKDKDLAKKMGEEGRRKAKEFFSLDEMIENTMKVYEEVIQSRIHGRRFLKLTEIVKILKLIIANTLYRSGLVHLYFLLSNKMSNRNIRILCYHKIENDEDPLDMTVSQRFFEKQLVTLGKFYKIISLSEAVDVLKGNGAVPYNAIVVTFDDGYESLYTNVYPIIRRHRIPATFFPVTNMIDNERVIWHDMLCKAIDETNTKEIVLDGKKFDIGDQYAKNLFKRNIVAMLKDMDEDRKKELMNTIILQLDNEDGKTKSRNDYRYLTKNEIKEMLRNGITFGSHSLNHVNLDQVPIELARKEIVESKSELEKVLKVEIGSFAYPNGNYNKELKAIVKEAGYACAVTLDCGPNKKKDVDMFSLKRINITENMCTNILGRYSEALFLYEVSGLNKMLLSPFWFFKNKVLKV